MLRAFAHHVVCCCVLLRLVATCWMKFETGQTSSNNFQQVATTHNKVCKRSQHVGPNNVASCWPTMLRAFARALTYKAPLSTCLTPNFRVWLPHWWNTTIPLETNPLFINYFLYMDWHYEKSFISKVSSTSPNDWLQRLNSFQKGG